MRYAASEKAEIIQTNESRRVSPRDNNRHVGGVPFACR